MTTIIISNLPPAPPVSGSGTVLATDIYPATDTTDTTEAATGTTKKYTIQALFNFIQQQMGGGGGGGGGSVLAANVATTLPLTATYNNGAAGVGATLTNSGALAALVVNGVTLNFFDSVLVKDQAAQEENGLYVVTTTGSGSVAWVLTRSTDYDTITEITYGSLIITTGGTINGNRTFKQTSPTPTTIGTDPITFALWAPLNDFQWNLITNTSATMAGNQGYVTDNVGLVTLTLPATSTFGEEVKIVGVGAGGWSIAQAAGQSVIVGNASTTLGAGGSVSSTSANDSLYLVCVVADLTWVAVGAPQSLGLTIV